MPNVKYSEENLGAILLLIAKGITQPPKQASAIGISPDRLNKWLYRSNGNDPLFLITYHGEQMQFAKAYSLAKRFALLELRGLVEQKSIFGTVEPSLKDGQLVWALDPAAVPLDRETRIMLGYHPDALKLDAQGRAVPVMIHTDAPVGLQLRVLESAFKDFRPNVISEVTVSGSVGVGVAFAPKQNFAGPPPQIPPMPPMPELEILGDVSDDPEDIESLFRAPTPPPVSIVLAPQVTIEEEFVPEPAPPPQQVIREENPAEYTPEPSLAFSAAPRRAPRNDLERDLFEKLAAARSKTA